jgi:response regulator of citrate/malate metabolism
LVAIKKMHVNSKVYNYSESKISKQSGLSRTATKKYIKFFIDNGWAKIKGKDLVFISTNKLKYKYGIS